MSQLFRKKYRVIFNPTAGRRKQSRIWDIVGRLKSAGAVVDISPTTGPGHASVLSKEAAIGGLCDAVVAAGGDGTISECATGLLQASEEGLASAQLPPLGILPMGTANVLAIDLGLVTLGGIARRKVTRTLLHGPVRSLQLGQVENALEKRAFVMMVGAGFDGAAVGAVNPAIKKRFGKVAYVKSAIEAFIAGPGGGVSLSSRSSTLSKHSPWVIISNGQHYAGGYRLTRRTTLMRNSLAALSVTGVSRLAVLRANSCLGLGLFDGPFNAQACMGQSFRIEPGGRHCMVQVDGDYFGLAPVDVTMAAEPIRFLVPERVR